MTAEQRTHNREYKRAYNLRNREKIILRKRLDYIANRDKYLTIERDRQYRARYGITLRDYEQMLAAQNGKCAICSSDVAGKCGQAFAVDHCHVSGSVRGLLCIKCNARLGWFERHAESVTKYLIRAKHG